MNTSDGVNMVVLITEEPIFSAEDMCSMAVDERNAFNKAKRQAFVDAIYLYYPELSILWPWDMVSPCHIYLDVHGRWLSSNKY